MKRKRIEFFQETILNWFNANRRNYPWRRTVLSPYKYIVAEILLQRTKADTVAKFYPLFIKQYPDWKALAKADVNDIAEYLRPIGLFRQRAGRLKSLAIEMVIRNCILPENRKDLESIPFMGQYIANAVELIIFNKPSPLIDVNMSRVLERFFEPRKMADIRYDPDLQKLAFKIVNHSNSKEINWAILDFAALVCTARNPKHENCPLSSACNYYKTISNQILI